MVATPHDGKTPRQSSITSLTASDPEQSSNAVGNLELKAASGVLESSSSAQVRFPPFHYMHDRCPSKFSSVPQTCAPERCASCLRFCSNKIRAIVIPLRIRFDVCQGEDAMSEDHFWARHLLSDSAMPMITPAFAARHHLLHIFLCFFFLPS